MIFGNRLNSEHPSENCHRGLNSEHPLIRSKLLGEVEDDSQVDDFWEGYGNHDGMRDVLGDEHFDARPGGQTGCAYQLVAHDNRPACPQCHGAFSAQFRAQAGSGWAGGMRGRGLLESF